MYFAQFLPGFSALVIASLQRDVPDVIIEEVFESSIVFSTNLPYFKVARKQYFSNIFLLLAAQPVAKTSDVASVKQAHLNAHYPAIMDRDHARQRSTFRVMVQKGNSLLGVPRDVLQNINSTISKKTRLMLSPLKATVEVWFLIRNEGLIFVGVKYIDHQKPHHKEQKGELKEHTAYMLNLLSRPVRADVVLDPFLGYGALLHSRTRAFSYSAAYGSDTFITDLASKKLKNIKNCSLHKADARSLTYLADNSIDCVVTDPPWGLYDSPQEDLKGFYDEVLSELVRVAKPDTRMVILMRRDSEFSASVASFTELKLQQQLNTLINGKKATVFLIHVSK